MSETENLSRARSRNGGGWEEVEGPLVVCQSLPGKGGDLSLQHFSIPPLFLRTLRDEEADEDGGGDGRDGDIANNRLFEERAAGEDGGDLGEMQPLAVQLELMIAATEVVELIWRKGESRISEEETHGRISPSRLSCARRCRSRRGAECARPQPSRNAQGCR